MILLGGDLRILTCQIDGPKISYNNLIGDQFLTHAKTGCQAFFPQQSWSGERIAPHPQKGRSGCRFVVGSVVQHTWPLNMQGLYRFRSKSTFSWYTTSFPFTPSCSRSAHR